MFPPHECADEDGLLAVGGTLDSATLAYAYSKGVFPWPVEGLPVLWFSPPQRCILRLDEFHVSKRLRRDLKNAAFEYSIDTNFDAVIAACAAERHYAEGTWITTEMEVAYQRLHREGVAHSVETYCNGELVGGLYGVSWGTYFCGEACFIALQALLKRRWFSGENICVHAVPPARCAMPTPYFESFGAALVPRDDLSRWWSRRCRKKSRCFNKTNILLSHRGCRRASIFNGRSYYSRRCLTNKNLQR
jgi:leucyl/phenylalanyl-tRNA--protein transferase